MANKEFFERELDLAKKIERLAWHVLALCSVSAAFGFALNTEEGADEHTWDEILFYGGTIGLMGCFIALAMTAVTEANAKKRLSRA